MIRKIILIIFIILPHIASSLDMADYDDHSQRENLVRDEQLDSEASEYRSNLKKGTINPTSH